MPIGLAMRGVCAGCRGILTADQFHEILAYLHSIQEPE